MYRGWDPPDHQAVPLPLAVHQPPTVQPAHPRHPLSSNLNWTFFSFAVVFPLTYGLNEAFRRRETVRRLIFRPFRVHVALDRVRAYIRVCMPAAYRAKPDVMLESVRHGALPDLLWLVAFR